MSTVDARDLFPSSTPLSCSRNRRWFARSPFGDSRRAAGTWWTMMLASSVALAVSSYLAWTTLTSTSVLGCGTGAAMDCSHVLHSRWSTVLSIPVSIPAVATYLGIIGLLLMNPAWGIWRRYREEAIGVASLAAGGAAVWFLGLQFIVLREICPYCLVAHICGLIVAGAFLGRRALDGTNRRRVAGIAATLVACLIALQLLNEPPQSFEVIDNHDLSPSSGPGEKIQPSAQEPELFEPPASVDWQARSEGSNVRWQAREDLPFLMSTFANPATLLFGQVSGAKKRKSESNTTTVLANIELSTTDWPLVGNPEAEMVFVELFDYTCEHCQRTHHSLDAARKQIGERLAIIALPVPLDAKCNPTVKSTHTSHREACDLAKLAIAVWIVDKEQFATFHDYLFTSKASYATALREAAVLVDSGRLNRVLQSSAPNDYLQRHIALYQKAGAGAIPKMLFPKTTIVGSIDSSEAMVKLIEQNL